MRETYAPREEFVGDDATDTFSFSFKITDLSQLLVVKSDDTGVEVFNVRGDDATYIDSVTFDAVNGGGEVVLVDPVELDYNLAIIMADDEPTQDSQFKNKGDFTLSNVEAALDRVSGAVQRLAYLFKRTPKTAETVLDADVAAFDYSIPDPAGNAGKILAVNAGGTGFEWVDP